MTPVRFVLALLFGALPEVVSSDPALGYPLHYRHRPPAGPQFPHYFSTPQRPPRTPLSPLAPRAPRPVAFHAGHAPRPHPGAWPAGGPWVNVTDFGAPCLRWADVPPFLERSPPSGWASLRGQRHNFCRSPDGAGRPWCFYPSARGQADWGHCDPGHDPRNGNKCCVQSTKEISLLQPGSPFSLCFLRVAEWQVLTCHGPGGLAKHAPSYTRRCPLGAGPASPVLRLVGGSSGHEGRVELRRAGQWGTVCDDQWDDADAEVVCRQLGLSGVARAWTQAHFGEGSGPVLLDEVRCTGNELSIEQCPKSAWGEHNCGHREDAGVSCTPLTDGVLRLAGGKDSHEGRLEVYYRGQWGTVCGDGWTELNTRVVCRQLGLKSGRPASATHFEGSAGPTWLGHVRCSGRETSLLQCARPRWDSHDCSHPEGVGVTCSAGGEGHRPSLGFPVRLVDGEDEKEGRVEVFIHGQWGTICDDGWTDKDAAVTCRQLGYRGPARARAMAYFGEGKGPIHMDNVQCTGAERSLADCIKQEIGRHNCRHSEDAGVICDYFGKKAPGNSDKAPLPAVCGLRPLHRRQKRIIGGKHSLRGGWPWQASLRLKSSHGDGRLLCGATLLSSCWVLTAAHCFKRYGHGPRSYAVRVGDYHTLVPEEFEEEIGVEQIVVHGAYRPNSSDYDIALVRLRGSGERCARLSGHVLPACLPLWRERPQKTASNCHITGRAYSRTLQQAGVPLLPRRVCEERYKGRFTRRMLCAGNLREHSRVDSCQGDSGGPLVCERPGASWAVYGVTSWGHGCGVKDSPGVYTKVSAFVPWIKSVTKL